MTTQSMFQPEAYGRYYLVDKIAVGGMAEVFKARRFSDGGFQMLLVIKRILQQFSENDEFVQMFVDEAKISVQLQHPNIVQIYDFGKLRDNYFIAMECVDGKDMKGILRALARRRKLLPQEYAVYIAHEVCKGLSYAHSKTDIEGKPLTIVHRDISPSNILISYGGDIKIADFGIAKAQTSAYTTKDGVLKGKFEYMSPEQASGISVTALSDQFSVGILLHEMLTGRRLFKTDADIKTLEKIKAVDIEPPSARNPRVPRQLDEIVMRALSRSTTDRFRDCKELQTALAEHLYPATPSATGDSLADFMKELFREDIEDERRRLQSGTRIANNLHEQSLVPDMATEEWTAGFSAETLQKAQGTLSGATGLTALGSGSSSRGALIAILAVLLLSGAGIGGWILTHPPAPPVVEPPPPPAMGALQVQLRPEGTIGTFSIDGQEVGQGPSLVHDVLPGQALTLRIAAEGFKPHEETITVAEGERLRLPISLEKLPRTSTPPPPSTVVVTTPPPPTNTNPPPPTETASPPRVGFASTPSGASVYVDGRLIGKTPMTWRDGDPGTSHSVELQLSGHETQRFTAAVPRTGGQESYVRTLSAIQADPGKVTVQVKGWANVYVDGQLKGETPLTIKLSPGSHTIRVENPETGYKKTETVEVTSGKTTTVTL